MTGAAGGDVIEAEVGVVGAGPGGLAVAAGLAARGVDVVVLDEGARAGGQIFRQLPVGFRPRVHPPEPPSHALGHALLRRSAAAAVRVEQRAVVWDAAPGHLWFEQGSRSRLLRCAAIVLATGALDRCVPFPGWTLPGVITAGAAQVMVRGYGVKPGARALVAGTGPLLLPTVTALLAAGVDVVSALEAAPRRAMLRALPGVVRSSARLREAWFYARQLLRAGVRLRWGHTVFAAEGAGRVQRAVIGRVDGSGRPLRHTARTVEVDVVCAGFGLVPQIELAQRLGCEIVWNEVRGGWCVGATAAGVATVGEINGIGGGEVAIAEGDAVAERLARQLRPAADAATAAGAAGSQARAVRARSVADAMLRAFPVLPGLFELAADDTVVCRCEDVTLAQVRAAAQLHGASSRGIKMGCRAGMGPCQGRICGPNLQACAAGRAERPDLPVVQVPLKPVRTATILDAPPAR